MIRNVGNDRARRAQPFSFCTRCFFLSFFLFLGSDLIPSHDDTFIGGKDACVGDSGGPLWKWVQKKKGGGGDGDKKGGVGFI